eukprot:m.292546 g.292546  ORF g.292546 m.292546 type:complete len:81 (+) comp20002_c0_seq2:306-548(+)
MWDATVVVVEAWTMNLEYSVLCYDDVSCRIQPAGSADPVIVVKTWRASVNHCAVANAVAAVDETSAGVSPNVPTVLPTLF